jgi:hypothetical protein
VRTADGSFWDLVHTALHQGSRVLAVEKIARGAGQTRWFLLRGVGDLEVVASAVRPGSAVKLYIDPAVAAEGDASPALLETLELKLAAIRSTENDLVALAVRDDGPLCDHFFPDRSEVADWLREHSGAHVILRHYPQLREHDAEALVPDADGVIRRQPH